MRRTHCLLPVGNALAVCPVCIGQKPCAYIRKMRRSALRRAGARALSAAPMMGYTDRHLRYLYRLLSKDAVLYTEMAVSNAIVHNESNDFKLRRWLGHSLDEKPVVLQLGGNDPQSMGHAAAIAHTQYNFNEINVNCGCPSPRVAGKGAFGAQLMYEPDKVARICEEMLAATSGEIPITIKCRIGVDEQEDFTHLDKFVRTVSKVGVSHFIVHARKAILDGLSPEQNRNIPPLKYEFVYELAAQQYDQDLQFTINGGVESLEDVRTHLDKGVQGVMIGRALLNEPYLLSEFDAGLRIEPGFVPSTRREVLIKYLDYANTEFEQECCEDTRYNENVPAKRLTKIKSLVGGRLLKPLLNLFKGQPGGQKFRGALMSAGGWGCGDELAAAAMEAYEHTVGKRTKDSSCSGRMQQEVSTSWADGNNKQQQQQ